MEIILGKERTHAKRGTLKMSNSHSRFFHTSILLPGYTYVSILHSVHTSKLAVALKGAQFFDKSLGWLLIVDFNGR